MKTIVILFSILIGSFFIPSKLSAQAAPGTSKKATVEIRTSSVCGMCKTTIETGLAKEKGINSSNLNVGTKIVKVVYNPQHITVEKIKKAISLLGYDADEVTADPVAYSKLDPCCKKGAHD